MGGWDCGVRGRGWHGRRQDFGLTDEQEAIRDLFARFFAAECSSERVRAAEPLGHDPALLARLVELDAISMGLSEERGGIAASVADLALVIEQFGRAAAPAPLVEAMVAARLLAGCEGETADRWAVSTADGTRMATLALEPVTAARQLVPAGAVASAVVALHDDELILVAGDPPSPAANLGHAPLAWWDLADAGSRTVLARGGEAQARFAAARDEWRLLTAAALVGLSQWALDQAVEFARTRMVSGVPIGALQGVSHPLADAAGLLVSARNLTRRAAWLHDHEPAARPELAPMAFVHAARAATTVTATALHAQGGFGFTLESDVTLCVRRAKGWSVVGAPRHDLQTIGDALVQRAVERLTTDKGEARGLQPA